MANQTQSGFNISSFVFLALFFHGGHSFRLIPSSAPQDYYRGDLMMVKVKNLASSKAPQFLYSHHRNLWDALRHDYIQSSPYEFRMRAPVMCRIADRIKLNEQTANELKKMIDDEYRVEMFLDLVPLVVQEQSGTECHPTITYQHGFFVGHKLHNPATFGKKYYFMNNHLSFVVKYHEDVKTSSARVVGFEVKTSSIEHKFDLSKWGENTRLTTCDPHSKHHQVTNYNSAQEINDDTKEILFTYDVEYQETDVKWSSRWDTYIPISDNQIQWFDWATRL